MMENTAKRLNVLGVRISVTNMCEAIEIIQRWIESSERHYACLAAVHGVMECQKDESLKQVFNQSGLTLPDGMPLVWAGRQKGFSAMGRVYGPDLMLELSEVSVGKGYSHFLCGGKEGIAERLKLELEKRFPGIRIAGTYTPPFRQLDKHEEEELISRVATLKPDIFWVGISTPKQEKFMAEYISRLNTRVMLGVGAAFDFHTGAVKEAPAWMKRTGLQWLFRLCQEPKRLWRRYLFNNPLFVYKYIKQLLKGNEC